MQVILLERVVNLGTLGDKVDVKPGYARNYLLPRKKAVIANAANLANFEQRKAEFEKLMLEKQVAVQERAEKLAEITLEVAAKAAEGGKLYGSIGPRDLVKLVAEKGVAVTKNEVILPDSAIRNLGSFEVSFRLDTETLVTVPITVKEDEQTQN